MDQKDSVLKTITQFTLEAGIGQMMADIFPDGDGDHITDTPQRYVRGMMELISGVNQDPAAVLKTGFAESHYDQMISVEDIDFVSLCKHHLLPFHGFVHFGYIPDQRIVGLSKIPRMVEIIARRPQTQEQLTQQLVQVFQETLNPLGCIAMVEAWHACVGIRGIRKPNSRMRTTALTGLFLTKPAVKEEFLLGVLRGRK